MPISLRLLIDPYYIYITRVVVSSDYLCGFVTFHIVTFQLSYYSEIKVNTND